MNHLEGALKTIKSSTPRGTVFGTGNNRSNLSTRSNILSCKLPSPTIRPVQVMDSWSLNFVLFKSFRPIIPVEAHLVLASMGKSQKSQRVSFNGSSL